MSLQVSPVVAGLGTGDCGGEARRFRKMVLLSLQDLKSTVSLMYPKLRNFRVLSTRFLPSTGGGGWQYG